MLKEKLKSIDETLREIEKQFGKGLLMKLGERKAEKVPTLSTGCSALDEVLGCGGLPRGRLIEIYGPESSGKTTLALHAIAECQRAGGVAAIIDAEHALDVNYAQALGVNVDELLLSQPDNGEQALNIVEALVKSENVGLIVIDSVAALVPQAELDGEMGDLQVGLQARMMSKALRKITGITYRSGCTVVFINQLRMKIGHTMGSPETTTGGNALKFYASVRIDIRRIGSVTVGEDVVGNRTRVKIVKNKLAPPFRRVEFDIRYGLGIDNVADILDRAVEKEIISKKGAYYCLGDDNTAQGRENARKALLDDPALYERLRAGVFQETTEAIAA